VAVSRENNGITDFVGVEMVQNALAIGLVSVPVVKIHNRSAESQLGEDNLLPDNSPDGTTIFGLRQRVIKPVFLSGPHHRAVRKVSHGSNQVMIVVDVCHISVIVAGIQHGKIQELSDLEVPPDPELIKSGNLPDRKPFVISPNCGELSVGETGAGRRKGAPGVGVV